MYYGHCNFFDHFIFNDGTVSFQFIKERKINKHNLHLGKKPKQAYSSFPIPFALMFTNWMFYSGVCRRWVASLSLV
jgi:hypothetical protein